MKINIFLIFSFSLFIIQGCEDKSIINIYDKSILQSPPTCLSLSIVPPHPDIEKKLNDMYHFDPECPYVMEVSYKNNIHCNSNQNSDKKALSVFPSSFLSIGIRKGMRVRYEYYIDLTKSATADDAEDAMERIMKDLKLD